MTVLDTCKFENVAIKTEGARPRTKSNKGLFSTQRQVTLMAEIETHLRFYACPGYREV